MTLPFIKFVLKDLLFFLNVVLEVLEFRNENTSKAFDSMHSLFQTITPMCLLTAALVACDYLFFTDRRISCLVQWDDFIDESLIIAKFMMIIDISQVCFYLLQLGLEIVNNVAILVGVKIIQASPHKRTEFFYI